MKATEIRVQDTICATAGGKLADGAWTEVFDPPQALAALQRPAVVFLYIEHAEIVRAELETMAATGEPHHAAVMRKRFAELSGLDCLVVHASQLADIEFAQPQIKAVLISGRSSTNVRPDDERFYGFLRTTTLPLIGFCGGCQLIGNAYGTPLVPLRRLTPGETDPFPSYHAGTFKEYGFLDVRIGKRDPLFAGLPEKPVFKQAHAFQLADVPPGFELLASSTECRVQAIKDRRRMVYGVQFHTEAYDDQHPDGRTLLANFFRLALARHIYPLGPSLV